MRKGESRKMVPVRRTEYIRGIWEMVNVTDTDGYLLSDTLYLPASLVPYLVHPPHFLYKTRYLYPFSYGEAFFRRFFFREQSRICS